MKILTNQNGFTYILALTIVVIMGIMLGMVGQSWKTIKQREQEKELLFRGSQIKEAIENWYNPKFKPAQMPHDRKPRPLMDLKELLKDDKMPQMFRYIPQSYAAEVDDKNKKCAPDCARLKIYQDPMTGKEWTIIRGSVDSVKGVVTVNPGSQVGGIIGVASKSDETPFKTDFKDTALEKMGQSGVAAAPVNAGTVPPAITPVMKADETAPVSPLVGGAMTKYSEWQFIADPKNDHTKIFRAYHEGW